METLASFPAWLRSAKNIEDLHMRAHRIAQEMERLPRPQVVADLRRLIAWGGQGAEPADKALAAFVLLLEEQYLSYDCQSELYAEAREQAMPTLAYALLESNRPSQLEEEEDASTPLGIRKSRARSSDAFQLSQLLHDPHPQVIEILLGNPRIVERQVLTMASKRPSHPQLLRQIAHHPRWSSRPKIQLAIALNPQTPLSLSCRLCLSMPNHSLKDVCRQASAPPLLRAHAERVLACRMQLDG